MSLTLSKKYTTNSVFFEAFLVSFPIWLPIIYCLLLFNYPSLSLILVWIVLFGLGEIHFGITWIFIFDKRNHAFLLDNKLYSIYVPVVIVLFFILVWFILSPSIALFISIFFNIFHVSRQSTGITKLYTKETFYKKTSSTIIYSNTLLFLGYGFFKHLMTNYVSPELLNVLFYFSILYLILSILFCIFMIFAAKEDINTWFATITGALLYAPFLSNLDLVQASAIGIGMHYLQYITLQIILYYRKLNTLNTKPIKFSVSDIIIRNKYVFSFYILIYSILMALLLYFGRDIGSNDSFFGELNILYLVPFLFHNLHFYADMFLWKFSNPYIRKSIGSYLFKSQTPI